MRRLLVVKVGGASAPVPGRPGDFEDWTLQGLQVGPADAWVIDVRTGAPLPALDRVCGAVVTGSHAMVTDRQPWSERTAAWLAAGVAAGLPLLGICYGHQLLAHALGGAVGDNPAGREYGTVEARLTEDGRADPLLGGAHTSIRVHVSHRQSALRLPPQARLLASSQREPHQAFRLGPRAWGVQLHPEFHPEFDARVTAAIIGEHRQDLLDEGQDPDALLAGLQDTPWADRILSRFRHLTQST